MAQPESLRQARKVSGSSGRGGRFSIRDARANPLRGIALPKPYPFMRAKIIVVLCYVVGLKTGERGIYGGEVEE